MNDRHESPPPTAVSRAERLPFGSTANTPQTRFRPLIRQSHHPLERPLTQPHPDWHVTNCHTTSCQPSLRPECCTYVRSGSRSRTGCCDCVRGGTFGQRREKVRATGRHGVVEQEGGCVSCDMLISVECRIPATDADVRVAVVGRCAGLWKKRGVGMGCFVVGSASCGSLETAGRAGVAIQYVCCHCVLDSEARMLYVADQVYLVCFSLRDGGIVKVLITAPPGPELLLAAGAQAGGSLARLCF